MGYLTSFIGWRAFILLLGFTRDNLNYGEKVKKF